MHQTAICIKAGSQSKAFHNKDEMAEKTAILFWLMVYVISTLVLVTVEAVYKIYSISKFWWVFFLIFLFQFLTDICKQNIFAAVVNFVLAYTCSTVPLCFCFVLLILFRKALFLNTKHFSKKMHLDFHLVIFFIFFFKDMTKLCKSLFRFQFLLDVIWKLTTMSILTAENTMLLDAMP